jgi:hypothetical protein
MCHSIIGKWNSKIKWRFFIECAKQKDIDETMGCMANGRKSIPLSENGWQVSGCML